MKPSPDSTSNRPTADFYVIDGREPSAERLRLARPPERPSLDLLNVLLPEWPAQACSWA